MFLISNSRDDEVENSHLHCACRPNKYRTVSVGQTGILVMSRKISPTAWGCQEENERINLVENLNFGHEVNSFFK